MAPQLEAYWLLTIAYWLVMIPIAAVILIKVTGYCIDDVPSTFLRAMLQVVGVAAAVFLVYDLAGYFFMLLMQDPDVGIRLPLHFSYLDWLREPVALKWKVLSFVPFIRYIPLGIALIIGCVVQVFIWRITFRFGLLIFLAQLILDLTAMVLLSFAFRVGIEMYAKDVARAAPAAPVHHGEAADPKSGPANLGELGHRVANLESDVGSVWRRLGSEWKSVNGLLAPLYGFLQPVTDHLPLPAQDFLNAGGWVVVLAGIVALVYFWPRFHSRRKHHRHRHRAHRPGAP